MNTVPVKQERGDPCWQDNLNHCSSQQVLLMTTPTPSTEVLVQEDFFAKKKKRIEKLSQQDRLSKYCTDAGFLTSVEVGQYFMTKDTEEFSQFTEPVACREYTLPRDDKLI